MWWDLKKKEPIKGNSINLLKFRKVQDVSNQMLKFNSEKKFYPMVFIRVYILSNALHFERAASKFFHLKYMKHVKKIRRKNLNVLICQNNELKRTIS